MNDAQRRVDFLGSPQAGWISGQDIHIDAGYICSMTAGDPITV